MPGKKKGKGGKKYGLLHCSTCWYFASAACFIMVAVATGVAKDRHNNHTQVGPELRANSEDAQALKQRANPAPSVKLEVVTTDWCAPCQRLKPILAELKKEGYSIKILSPEDRPGTTSVPSLQFFKFSKPEGNRLVGFRSKEELKRTFAKIEGSVFKPKPPKEKPWWVRWF